MAMIIPLCYLSTEPCLIVRFVFLDNVHFQQAAEISEALVEEQVDFEAMVSNLGNATDNCGTNVMKHSYI